MVVSLDVASGIRRGICYVNVLFEICGAQLTHQIHTKKKINVLKINEFYQEMRSFPGVQLHYQSQLSLTRLPSLNEEHEITQCIKSLYVVISENNLVLLTKRDKKYRKKNNRVPFALNFVVNTGLPKRR